MKKVIDEIKKNAVSTLIFFFLIIFILFLLWQTPIFSKTTCLAATPEGGACVPYHYDSYPELAILFMLLFPPVLNIIYRFLKKEKDGLGKLIFASFILNLVYVILGSIILSVIAFLVSKRL